MNRRPTAPRTCKGDVVARVAVVIGLTVAAGLVGAGFGFDEPADASASAGVCDPTARAPLASL